MPSYEHRPLRGDPKRHLTHPRSFDKKHAPRVPTLENVRRTGSSLPIASTCINVSSGLRHRLHPHLLHAISRKKGHLPSNFWEILHVHADEAANHGIAAGKCALIANRAERVSQVPLLYMIASWTQIQDVMKDISVERDVRVYLNVSARMSG